MVQLWHKDIKLSVLDVWTHNQNSCYQAFVWKCKLSEFTHLGLQLHDPIPQISPKPFFSIRDLKSQEKQSKLISFHRLALLDYRQKLLDPRHISVMWPWCTSKSLPVQILQTIGMHLSAYLCHSFCCGLRSNTTWNKNNTSNKTRRKHWSPIHET